MSEALMITMMVALYKLPHTPKLIFYNFLEVKNNNSNPYLTNQSPELEWMIKAISLSFGKAINKMDLVQASTLVST